MLSPKPPDLFWAVFLFAYPFIIAYSSTDLSIDNLLQKTSKALAKLEKVYKGEVITLSAEGLPEKTNKQKKRKKYLLFFIKYWKELQSEIKRLEKELEAGRKKESSKPQKLSTGARIAKYAKGPLGVITLVAAGIIALQTLAVEVQVANIGCDPIDVSAYSIPLPGIKLPNTPIYAGESAVVKIPPLTMSVDLTDASQLRLSILGLGKTFEMGRLDLVFNDASLLGRKTVVRLGDRKQHDFVVVCE